MSKGKVVLLRLASLPKELIIEYHRDGSLHWDTNDNVAMYTDLPVSTLSNIDSMREHMVHNWGVFKDEISTEWELLNWLSHRGDSGAFIFRALCHMPSFNVTNATEILLCDNAT